MASVQTLTTIYSAHSTYLERVAASLGNNVIPYLESIEKRITKTLNAMPVKALSPQEVSAIRSEIDKITREELQAYTTQYKIDNKEIGQHQVAFDAKTLESVTSGYEASIPSAGIVNKMAVTTPVKIGDNLYTTYNRYIANYWQNYTNAINDTVAAGFIGGGTNREIAANILSQITLDDDASDLSRAMRAAKAMARTGTSHYANQATLSFVDENDDVLIGYRFLATLDGRTSRECFVGETEITHFTDVERLYRSDYSGEIFTVTLSTGEKLIGTPNHPVLTQHGWTTIGELDPSKHVCYSAVDNVGNVLATNDVGVKTTIGELFDSLSKSPVVDVASESPSATDFNGDGVGMDGKVYIVTPKSHLRCYGIPCIAKSIVNYGLGLVHSAVNLVSDGGSFSAFVAKLKSIKPTKVFAGLSKCGIKACFTNASKIKYVDWPNSVIKKLNGFILSLNGFTGLPSSSSILHNAKSLEKACYSGGASVVHVGDLPCGNAVFIKQCDIVSIASEFKSCHVYTLQCSQGFYIASGSIVKNCSALDQQVFKTGEKKPSIPNHINCRSRWVYEVDGRYRYDDSASTRPSNFTDAEGERDPKRVSSKKKYYDSVKAMSEKDRISILGPQLGKALGQMDADTFAKSLINSTYQPLSIADMKAKSNELGRILKEQAKNDK